MIVTLKSAYNRLWMLVIVTIFFGQAGPVAAQTLYVAAAANFSTPIRQIAEQFEQRHGHTVRVSLGSSGKLYAQIHHGAPFHVFFSADQDKPKKLAQEKLAVANSQFTYAIGNLVLWAPTGGNKNTAEKMLKQGQFARLALANPKLAPYGLAALEVIKALDLESSSRGKWVMGENIAQTFQFVSSGNADLGFVALSQLLGEQPSRGVYWHVPGHYYQPIRQDAILLEKGKDNPVAAAFLEYVKHPDVRALIGAAGYQTTAGD